MTKKVKVHRYVYNNLKDESNKPWIETCEYSFVQACKQGFLASMVDSDHFITVEFVE